jgi:hypothetical protein
MDFDPMEKFLVSNLHRKKIAENAAAAKAAANAAAKAAANAAELQRKAIFEAKQVEQLANVYANLETSNSNMEGGRSRLRRKSRKSKKTRKSRTRKA